MHNRNVLISGAGIAGPTLAYWLLRHGFRPTLVERAPTFRTGGYMIDFWGVGYDVAERMGLCPDLHRDGHRVREVRFVNSAGRPQVTLDARRLLPSSGDRYVNVRRGDLARRIWQRVEPEVQTLFGESITGIEAHAEGVTVAFEGRPPREFDLLIGADGLHSAVRRLAFGAHEVQEQDLGYATAAFSVPDYPVREKRTYVSYTAPGRQVARYVLRDGRTGFFLLFTRPPGSGEGRDPAARLEALRQAFGGAGWECDAVLEALERADDLYLDTVSQVRMNTWFRDRVALLGDAAASPSLLSGQGSALAMAGAYLLARALAQAGGDHRVAFPQYQRAFKPFVEAKQRSARRYGAWFAPRTSLGVLLRTQLLRLMRVPALSAQLAARSFRDDFELPEDGGMGAVRLGAVEAGA